MSDFTDAVEGFDLGDSVSRDWQAGERNLPRSAASPASSISSFARFVP